MSPGDETGAWCEIHLGRIARNLDRALALVPKGRRFCAVLKGDAYGHGIANVVPLVRDRGIGCVGITSNAEARAVRRAGFDGTIIRLRAATPQEIAGAAEWDVQEQVSSVAVAERIRALTPPVRCHLALDAAGMSRDGLDISDEPGRAECRAILDLLDDHVVGICTHFASNAPADLRQSSARFQEDVDWVLGQSRRSRSDMLIHAGSSLTLVSDQPVTTDMYRCGAILYGILRPEWGFETTMDLKARVVSIGDYPAGASVGYDRGHTLDAPRRLACLSIGYANGVRRDTESSGAVLIGGRAAAILGKVSMNTLVVDVTGHERVSIGDEATVFGSGSGSAATERQFGSIMADLYSDWGLRNPRILSP